MSTELSVKLEELTERDKGRWIVWTDPGMVTTHKGRLKSWNHLFIFVVFKCGNNWVKFQDYTAEACQPGECRFLAPYHPVQVKDLPREN
jgi:hypothetical protein